VEVLQCNWHFVEPVGCVFTGFTFWGDEEADVLLNAAECGQTGARRAESGRDPIAGATLGDRSGIRIYLMFAGLLTEYP